MIWKCCAPLQIRLGLLGVLPKSTVDFLVEVGIPVVDEVHILVCMELAPPAVVVAVVLPAKQMPEHISAQELRELTPWQCNSISSLIYMRNSMLGHISCRM